MRAGVRLSVLGYSVFSLPRDAWTDRGQPKTGNRKPLFGQNALSARNETPTYPLFGPLPAPFGKLFHRTPPLMPA
jgi:hypothetical protein